MNIRRNGKALKLPLALVSMSILLLVLAACAPPTVATQPGPAVATSAPAAPPTTAPAATAATPQTQPGVTGAGMVMISKNDKLGDILTDDKGMTLYLYTKDTPNTSNCYDQCAVNWPPLLTAAAPKAGTGADGSLLGTTTRKDGAMQVTYNGWPLYYWIKDQKPGDATGQDVGDVWYVLNAKGEEVETPGEQAATPQATSAASSMAGTIMLSKNDKLGDILTDDKGMTLYLYTKDTPNTSNCYDQCAVNWPPLITTGAPMAGAGADQSLLGTTTRKDGAMQVTYNGWPLYYWVKDQKAGDATGQDVGGVWYVLNAEGEQVETPGGASSMPAAGSSAPAAAASTVNVSIENFSFGENLTIAAGTTVVWTNKDSAPHTVTASDGSFDSGNMDQGATFSFTFTKAGTFPYICDYHPNMKGTVTVTG